MPFLPLTNLSYFKGQKLDYPNNETPKTSRKYVRAMKKLNVRNPQGHTN